jgi:hypothetical protein
MNPKIKGARASSPVSNREAKHYLNEFIEVEFWGRPV